MARVLLVEDNEANRAMLARRLKAAGFEVVPAGDGREAVAAALDQRPDIILMDLALPGIDGWEATRQIKERPETRDIPVIAVTAHAMPGDRDRAFQSGCDDYETKPVEMSRLLGKIEALLAKRGVPMPAKPARGAERGTRSPERGAQEESGAKDLPARSASDGGSLDPSLALRAGNESSCAPPAPRPALPDGSSCPVVSKRILVVEDNDANRQLLARRLSRQGFQVGEAADGKQGLEMLRSRGFDLMLLDIMMPEMDGYQVLEIVKSDPVMREIPVIMISALDAMDSVVRCIEMGAEDYLTKPYDPVLLHARVSACLDKKRLRDQELEYLRQVAALTNAAVSVEAGAFDPASLDEVTRRDDELGRLARMFQHMAVEVQAREQRLRQEVQQLRVEIDEARKRQDVAKITGSETFVGTQQKLEMLRQRNRARQEQRRRAEAAGEPAGEAG